MPEIDFAILCHSAVGHGTMVSLLDGPIDTIESNRVPIMLPVSLVIRFLWTHAELNREHRGEIVLLDADSKQLMKTDFRTKVGLPENSPIGWKVGSNLILNFPLGLAAFGEYAIDIVVNDNSLKRLPLRAIEHGK